MQNRSSLTPDAARKARVMTYLAMENELLPSGLKLRDENLWMAPGAAQMNAFDTRVVDAMLVERGTSAEVVKAQRTGFMQMMTAAAAGNSKLAPTFPVDNYLHAMIKHGLFDPFCRKHLGRTVRHNMGGYTPGTRRAQDVVGGIFANELDRTAWNHSDACNGIEC